MVCPPAIELLTKLNTHLEALHKIFSNQYEGQSIKGRLESGWTFERKGSSLFYEKVVTFAGTTMNIDLDIPRSSQLNRVEQVFNDATARDFDIRIFTDASLSYYISLDTATTNTSLSHITQAGIEYKYNSGSRFRIAYSNFTVGKTVTIRVQVDEL